MKEGKASRSADASCMMRATEAMKPEDERICYDFYAKDFISGIYTIILKSRLITKLGFAYAERMGPGVRNFALGRTRCIDEYLKHCIEDRIKQLVILGAGYDSRAYRFDELKGKVKVFEVDHPDSQRVKMEKVKRIIGSLPDHVVYVPVDFENEKPNQKLFKSGYDKDLRTLFIWEGVTYYVTAEAVDETLVFVVNNSGQGSSIIFDYMFKSAVDGTCKLEEAITFQRRARRQYSQRGEPILFGIEKGAVEDFLCQRGFHQVEDLTGQVLKDIYFVGKNKDRPVARYFGIVHATVKTRG